LPPPEQPALPAFTWSYLGSFGPPDRLIAVFGDGNTIHNAQQGDILAGQFIVVRIATDAVDLRLAHFPEQPAQRVTLSP
jgi:hypothetical protein